MQYTPDSYLFTFEYEGKRQTIAKTENEARSNLYYKLVKNQNMSYSEFNSKCELKNKAYEKDGRIRFNKHNFKEQEDNWRELELEMALEHEIELGY